jgi:hydroxyacylglutathione hydrolase
MLAFEPIAAFTDNYLWLLHDGQRAVVVDPGDAAPVDAALVRLGLRLAAILVTHHHPDHTGGVVELARHHGATVHGPAGEAIDGVDVGHVEGDVIDLESLGRWRVLDTPGHTRGHIAYDCAEHGALLCGDTLFSAGCGRLFEGTPQQMLASLDKLAALPADRRVFCTHEYTLANLRFAAAAEPGNRARDDYRQWCEAERAAGRPTLPSTIGRELEVNPFLRCGQPDIGARLAERFGAAAAADRLAVFTTLRAWKDRFG